MADDSLSLKKQFRSIFPEMKSDCKMLVITDKDGLIIASGTLLACTNSDIDDETFFSKVGYIGDLTIKEGF